MTVIKIAFEESPEAVQRVERRAAEIFAQDSDWNGHSFEIVRDEYTSIDSEGDGYAAARLLAEVQGALSGE